MSDKVEVQLEGFEEVERLLKYVDKDRVAKTTEVILNKTAGKMREAEKAEINRVFDRPTPTTQNACWVDGASAVKGNLSATVKLKDDFSGGTSPTDYLRHQVAGGKRAAKPFERRLHRFGAMPDYMHATPTEDAVFDRYGNVPQGQITKILSGLQMIRESRSRKTQKYFVIPRVGIWETRTNETVMIFAFHRRRNYTKRFDFYGVGEKAMNDNLVPIAEEAVDRVIKWQTGL